MKNFKKIASAIAALSLAACVAVPMSATVFTASAEVEIQVNPNANSQDNGTHKYEAYKIFSGTMETVSGGSEKVLVGLDWAFKENADSDKKSAFLEAIKTTLSEGTFSATPTASEVAEAIKGDDDNAKAIAFSNLLSQYLDLFDKTSPDTDGKLKVNDAGYYLVQDAEDPELGDNNSGAKTRYILKVVDPDESPLKIEAKSAAPTVDKLVKDEEGDAEAGSTGGWGETADHAIGEKFQFKLIATLPDSAEIDKYDAYKLVFNDTYSAGVDYVGESKIVITPKVGDAITVEEASFSTNVTVNHATTGKVTVTIDNLKTLMTDASLQGAKVEFIYSAKLNDKAIVHNASNGEGQLYSEDDGAKVNVNYNDVYLEYSNNPNVSGGGNWDNNHGETPKDTVGVFTYKVTNSKVDAATKTTKLEGAKFSLYAKDPFAEGNSSEEPIELVEVKGDGGAILGYRPKTTDDDTSVETVTKIDTVAGQDFLFYGLDSNDTYYLKEEKAPNGYNLLEKAVEIKVTATHSEVDDTKAKLDLGSSTMNNEIENAKGASLPSTGGIGTTLFYLGGGALVAVAGVMLITKKRMTKE